MDRVTMVVRVGFVDFASVVPLSNWAEMAEQLGKVEELLKYHRGFLYFCVVNKI